MGNDAHEKLDHACVPRTGSLGGEECQIAGSTEETHRVPSSLIFTDLKDDVE